MNTQINSYQWMTDILIEPGTGYALTYDKEHQLLVSLKSGRGYPIRDGIPIMLASEAVNLADIKQDEPVC